MASLSRSTHGTRVLKTIPSHPTRHRAGGDREGITLAKPWCCSVLLAAACPCPAMCWQHSCNLTFVHIFILRENGGRGAMLSHNAINDVPSHMNSELMGLLRVFWDLGLILTGFQAFLSSTPPYTRRVVCSTWRPCVSGANRRLQQCYARFTKRPPLSQPTPHCLALPHSLHPLTHSAHYITRYITHSLARSLTSHRIHITSLITHSLPVHSSGLGHELDRNAAGLGHV